MQHPFQVMCINSNWVHASRWGQFKAWLSGKKIIKPVFSNIYTVVDIQAYKGKEYYYLAASYKDDCYDTSGFVRLSGIDEMEFTRVPGNKIKH